ncbi:MAG: hypothetical protein C4288_09815 [Leptolyngbya sp. ERB_1_1]
MTEINCAEMCQNGCVLGDECPNREYTEQTSQFISDTPLDKLLEMADEAVRKKALERMSTPTQWILPEDN